MTVPRSITLTTDNAPKLTHAEIVGEVASIVFPEDGYETSRDNDGASQFQLLVVVAREYTKTQFADDGEPSANDYWATLQGLCENLTHEDGTTFSVEQHDPEE